MSAETQNSDSVATNPHPVSAEGKPKSEISQEPVEGTPAGPTSPPQQAGFESTLVDKQTSSSELTSSADGPCRQTDEKAVQGQSSIEEPTAGSGVNESTQKVEVHAPTKTMVNIAGSVFGASLESTPKFKDPMTALPVQVDSSRVDLNEAHTLIEVLKERRVIVLTSFEHQLAFAAAHSLAFHVEFSSYQKSLLLIDKKGERPDVTLDLFGRDEYHDKTKQVVLVEIDHDGLFLDSLRTRSYGGPAALRDLLSSKDIALICATSFEIFGTTTQRPTTDSIPYYQHEVSFLDYKLAQCFPRPEEAREVKERLCRLRRDGLWPTATEEDFLQQVSSHLRIPGQLSIEIERREKCTPASMEVQEETCTLVDLEAEFQEKSELALSALYTAAYFPGLTPSDFGVVVQWILGDSTTEVYKESQRVGEDGKIQVHREAVTRRLVDLWHESPDRILRDCCLETTPRGDDSVRVINVSSRYGRQEVRSYLESKHPMYLARTFRRLQQTGLLFSESLSEAVVDNLVRLSVERTLADPDYYDKSWLIGFIFGLRAQLPSAVNLDDPEQDFSEFLEALLENERVLQHVYARLCRLLREMLRHKSLQRTVAEFLDFLLHSSRAAALGIALEISYRLRFTPEFDSFYWLRQLLDRGGKIIQESVYNRLYALTRERGRRVYDVLEAIQTWLPSPSLESDRFSPSHCHALSFLPAYCFKSADEFPERFWGEWPTSTLSD